MSRSIERIEMKVKVAVVSPESYKGEKERKNVEIAKGYIDSAADENAKIVCFPEAYPGPFTGPHIYSAFDELHRKAAERGVYVIAGGLEEKSGKYYTTEWLIGPDGTEIGKYRRTTPAGPEVYENIFNVPFDRLIWGNELPVFETEYGSIGITVCTEIYAPELSRVLALKGADMIFSPAGMCPPNMFETWTTMLWPRAIENIVYVGFCQHMPQEGGLSGVGGATRILSPETMLAQSPFEGMLTATLDIERLDLLRGLKEDVTPEGLPTPYRRVQPALSSGLGFCDFGGTPISRRPELYQPIVMSKEQLGTIKVGKKAEVRIRK